jgi:hypothetical protein
VEIVQNLNNVIAPLVSKENIVKLNTNALIRKHQIPLFVILVVFAKMRIPVNAQESTLENHVNSQSAMDMHQMIQKYAAHWANALLQTSATAHQN